HDHPLCKAIHPECLCTRKEAQDNQSTVDRDKAGKATEEQQDVVLETFPNRRELRTVESDPQKGMNVGKQHQVDANTQKAKHEVDPFALLGRMDKEHDPHQK